AVRGDNGRDRFGAIVLPEVDAKNKTELFRAGDSLAKATERGDTARGRSFKPQEHFQEASAPLVTGSSAPVAGQQVAQVADKEAALGIKAGKDTLRREAEVAGKPDAKQTQE